MKFDPTIDKLINLRRDDVLRLIRGGMSRKDALAQVFKSSILSPHAKGEVADRVDLELRGRKS